ncbi:hypothetical protein [Sorangium sp. So ce887]|uniref:hypothetical protein n=1 Tax=Sorangium sp. So ce887 TaxID=3133324 RepID=UPI003F5F6E5F
MDSASQAFREIGAPSHEELEDIVQRIRERTLRWLRKCGLLDERPNEERSNEAPERSALDACAEVALRGGEFVRIEDETVVPPDDGGEARFEPKRRGPLTVELDGFNVEAAVRIEGYDDEGRERLVPPVKLPRFEVRMYWHERHHRDLAQQWFRDAVRGAAEPSSVRA